ncbi:hypothetical protein GCM10010347_45740 [Streptomyces cirratus]|uniref:Uncharacterized protein n=1 Tax=Streptomyces cirratus TaxID=68187 RepID=A0ABQ3EZW9_9ACTN|nr:hypothetical protein [Streptomyces cirratus]GHB70319.1 hypothetical protein GCM10010347_45740 [Streptomyces cirratus]
MGDVIALADRDPAVQPRLDRLVDGVCADLRAAADETGRRVSLAECVPGLYLALPPLTRPRVVHLEVHEGSRHIDVRYSWNTGPGRSAAITRALHRLRGEDGCGLEEIHAFLAMRILGVIPPTRLTGHDLLLVLIKLAESQHPLTPIDTFFTTTPAPHSHSGERSSQVPAPA